MDHNPPPHPRRPIRPLRIPSDWGEFIFQPFTLEYRECLTLIVTDKKPTHLGWYHPIGELYRPYNYRYINGADKYHYVYGCKYVYPLHFHIYTQEAKKLMGTDAVIYINTDYDNGWRISNHRTFSVEWDDDPIEGNDPHRVGNDFSWILRQKGKWQRARWSGYRCLRCADMWFGINPEKRKCMLAMGACEWRFFPHGFTIVSDPDDLYGHGDKII